MAAETRVRREFRFNAEGENDGSPPETFCLVVVSTPQKQHAGRRGGWSDTGPGEWVTLIEGMTRRQVATLIADAADWLAWDGTAG